VAEPDAAGGVDPDIRIIRTAMSDGIGHRAHADRHLVGGRRRTAVEKSRYAAHWTRLPAHPRAKPIAEDARIS
jgi:hypothetical protein